jgi:hypothetical protein
MHWIARPIVCVVYPGHSSAAQGLPRSNRSTEAICTDGPRKSIEIGIFLRDNLG